MMTTDSDNDEKCRVFLARNAILVCPMFACLAWRFGGRLYHIAHYLGSILWNCSGGMTGFRYTNVPFYIRPFVYLLQHVIFILQHTVANLFLCQVERHDNNARSISRQPAVNVNTRAVSKELSEIILGSTCR